MSDFFKGALCVFKGIERFYGDRSLWKYALKTWGVIIGVYIFALWLIFHFAGVFADHLNARLADYPAFFQKLLSGSLTLAAVLFSALLILTTISTIFEISGGFFFDGMIEEFEKKSYNTCFEKIPFKRQLAFIFQAAVYSFNTFLLLLLLLVVGIFLLLAGQVLLVIILGIRTGYALLFAPGFLRGKNIRETNDFFRSHRLVPAGFCICVYLLFLLPLALPLFLPGIVLGACMVYNKDF